MFYVPQLCVMKVQEVIKFCMFASISMSSCSCNSYIQMIRLTAVFKVVRNLQNKKMKICDLYQFRNVSKLYTKNVIINNVFFNQKSTFRVTFLLCFFDNFMSYMK